MTENNRNYTYDRYLSPLDVWAIAFGCTVGWGAFIMPGSTFLPVAGPLGSLIGLVIGVAIMLMIGANFSFLMRHKPGTGGVYAYTKEALGRNHAFMCAWFLSLSYLAILFLNAISLFTVIRTVFANTLQIGYRSYSIGGNVITLGEVGASIVALSCVGLLFINAKPLLQKLQTLLAVILLAGVLFVAALCLPHLGSFGNLGAGMKANGIGMFGIRGGSKPLAIFSIVMLAPFAFFGFEVISLETVHFKFKVHLSRWIIIASILLSGIVYISLTLVSVCAAPDGYTSWQAYITDLGKLTGLQSVPSFFSAQAIIGDVGLWVIALAALAAILTSMIAAYRATTRMLSTMAEDHLLSEKFSKTNHSILFIMVIAILVSILGKNMLDCFLNLASLGAVIGFGYTSLSAWKLARKNGRTLFALTGAAGTIASVTFAFVNLVPKFTIMEMMGSEAFLLLSLWCLLGLIFYLHIVARSGAAGSTSSSIAMFVLLLYSMMMWLSDRIMSTESIQAYLEILRKKGPFGLLVILIGLGIMLVNQNVARRTETEKIVAQPPVDDG